MAFKVGELSKSEGMKKRYLLLVIGIMFLTLFNISVSGQVSYPNIKKTCDLAPDQSCEIVFYDHAENYLEFNFSSNPDIIIEIFVADQSDHDTNNWYSLGLYGSAGLYHRGVSHRDNWYLKFQNVDVISAVLTIYYVAKSSPTEEGVSSYTLMLVALVSIISIGFLIKKIRKTTN